MCPRNLRTVVRDTADYCVVGQNSNDVDVGDQGTRRERLPEHKDRRYWPPAHGREEFWELAPLTDFEHRSTPYGRDAFTYEAGQDRYRCPEGHALVHERIKVTEGVIVYRSEAEICNACPIKTKCMTSNRGRIVHRSLFPDYVEQVRSYHATEAYTKAIRERQVWVEPLFAELENFVPLFEDDSTTDVAAARAARQESDA